MIRYWKSRFVSTPRITISSSADRIFWIAAVSYTHLDVYKRQVSAFCNAGIDILGSDSLAKYICNPLINITTMLLIILSGIGFSVWYDVLGNIKKIRKKEIPGKWWFTRLRLHSKLAIVTTLILLTVGTCLLYTSRCV